jgi:hypothetical protein
MGFVGYTEAIDAIVTDERLLSVVAALLRCDVAELHLFQALAAARAQPLAAAPRGSRRPALADGAHLHRSFAPRTLGAVSGRTWRC